VTIGGARRLPRGQAPRWLLRFLLSLPQDAEINLRSGMRKTEGFELDVYRLCKMIGTPVVWWIPEPNAEVEGRQATWERDYDMVQNSDLVIAFVTTDDLEREPLDSGTVRLTEKAQDRDVPSYLYGVDEDGSVYVAGASDVKNIWKDKVPQP
jgi:hypothetical protein